MPMLVLTVNDTPSAASPCQMAQLMAKAKRMNSATLSQRTVTAVSGFSPGDVCVISVPINLPFA